MMSFSCEASKNSILFERQKRRTSQFVLGSTKLCTRPANQHFGSHLDCDPFPSRDYLAMGRHLAASPLRVKQGRPELGAKIKGSVAPIAYGRNLHKKYSLIPGEKMQIWWRLRRFARMEVLKICKANSSYFYFSRSLTSQRLRIVTFR